MKQIVLAGTKKEPDRVEEDNRVLARKAAAEGFVLLENDGTLPLKTSRVALYGSGARMTVKGGTGSGAVRERYSVSIEEGLKNAGVEISTENWLDRYDHFYQDSYDRYRGEVEDAVKGMTQFYQILGTALGHTFLYPTGIPITQEDAEADRTSGVDTAIYVLARQAGEGADRKNVKGDYQLDDVERENLEFVSQHYEHFIVVVNAGGLLDLSFLDHIHVSALVYFVQGGEEGGNALADVLTGRQNFSGRLATTWPYDFQDVPSSVNYSYLGPDEHQQDYNEGIYVGYRYFDTFGLKPRYPFGYGLTYTSYELALTGLVQDRQNGRNLRADVAVTNKGPVSGKEVVQVYVTVPFGRDGAEKKRLVGFVKTDRLLPGQTKTVSIVFPVDAMAKYHTDSSAWVLEKGEYLLWIGDTSDAGDDGKSFGTLEAAAVIGVKDEIITEQCTAICPEVRKIDELKPDLRADEFHSFAAAYEKDAFHLDLDRSEIATKTHVYAAPEDVIDPKVSSLSDAELASLVCGGGTKGDNNIVLAMGASGTTTSSLYEKYGIPNVILSDGPAGLNLTPVIVEETQNTKDAQGVEEEETVFKAARVPAVLETYKKYFFGFAGKILMSQLGDPAAGIVHYQYATAWPCSQLLAQTWNTEILERVGDGIGKEMEKFGITVWLGPGMNIHRNPLCGRTFEYYSEDPVVSGKMAAAVVRGVQSHPGKGCSVKHFVCNNCELNRNSSSSNLSERTLREIYLRGFEIAVKESHPMTVMGSYNLVNGTYVNNSHDLLVKVLRNEWGFDGLVMSDWDAITCEPGEPMKAKTGDILKAQSSGCDLVMPGRPDQTEALQKGLTDDSIKREYLTRSATRIMKMIRENTILAVK